MKEMLCGVGGDLESYSTYLWCHIEYEPTQQYQTKYKWTQCINCAMGFKSIASTNISILDVTNE